MGKLLTRNRRLGLLVALAVPCCLVLMLAPAEAQIRNPKGNGPSSREMVWKCMRCGTIVARGPLRPTLTTCPNPSCTSRRGPTPGLLVKAEGTPNNPETETTSADAIAPTTPPQPAPTSEPPVASSGKTTGIALIVVGSGLMGLSLLGGLLTFVFRGKLGGGGGSATAKSRSRRPAAARSRG
jgi:hypothetical protein